MKLIVVIVAALSCLGMSNIVCAIELLPWQVEHVSVASPGIHSLKTDDRILSFEVPAELPTQSFRALEVITRGDKHEDWLKRKGEYEKDCFGLSWNFYWLGIPLLDQTGFMYISAKLHVKSSPESRAFRGTDDFDPRLGYLPMDADRGDFSKPEEMQANMDRFKGGDTTPVEEVIINNRKWYRYFLLRETVLPNNIRWLPSERYLTSREYYVTGLAPDRYLEVKVEYSYNPYQYSDEGQRPWWMIKPWWEKKASEYKQQVINSMRITRSEGSVEPDLYEVLTSMPPTVSTGTAPEQ